MAIVEGLVDLLETIRTRAELDYLSDLHSGLYGLRMRKVIAAIPEYSYTLAAWRDAAGYILGHGTSHVFDESFNDVAKVKQYLDEKLKNG